MRAATSILLRSRTRSSRRGSQHHGAVSLFLSDRCWIALFVLAVPLSVTARTLDVNVEAAWLRAACARGALTESVPTVARSEKPETLRRAVLPVLLGPGEEVLEVQAPWPVHSLGNGFYHGYAVAHLAVLARDLPASLPHTSRIQIVTRPSGARPARMQRPDALRSLQIRREVQALVLNPDALRDYAEPDLVARRATTASAFSPTQTPSLEGSPVEMLILTRDSLFAAFQAYADYKTGLGTPVVVRSIEWVQQNYPHGADLQETLRDFVRQAYQLWGIRYLLLGGDTELLPVRYATSLYSLEGSSVPTDLYFACLDGDWNGDHDASWGEGFDYGTNSSDLADLYPEVFVGRLPVTTPQEVQAYLRKLQLYTEPTVVGYQSNLLFLCEVIWPSNYKPGDPILKNGADNAERLIGFNDLDRPGLTLSRLYETPAGYPGAEALTRARAIDRMNAGCGLVTDIGHGWRYSMSLVDASLTNVQALQLTNGAAPFFLNMLNCAAAAFDFPCLAEKFVLNANGGAVGVIGTSREAYPDNIQLFQEEWFRKLFTDGYPGAAEALHEARLRYLSLSYDDGAYRWSNFITNYLGDPQVEVWTRTPATPVVTHSGSLSLGAKTYAVQVSADGAPVAGATVCLWKQGDFYAVERTNLSGVATLELNAESPGTAQLAVCGTGLYPYRGSATVQTAMGPSLRATGVMTVEDSGSGTYGNGNGVLEAGETAQVRFEVKNEGGTGADGVTLQAYASDPSVMLPGSAVSVGSLAAGAAALSQPLAVSVLSNALDLRHVGLDIVLRSMQGWSWSDRVWLDLLQVSPQVVRIAVDDYGLGNRNGIPDANETYVLRVDVENYGFARLDGAAGQLISRSPNLTVVAGSASFGNVEHMATASASFQVRESDVSQPNPFMLFVFDASGRAWAFNLETRRPQPVTNLAGDPSGGQGIAILTWNRSPSSDVLGYNVYRALRTSGPWVRASADLVRNATYFRDDGLQGGTRYYYQVAAVDSSHDESTRSTTLELTTNPPLAAGWPRPLGAWSNSSPVVADLDGDLHLEVVAGAQDHVYAWKPDGTEVCDGDANPATPGVFTPTTANFMPGLAAGDLDGDGRDEIVACTFDTRQVFVLQGDGSVRPGWPRSIVSTTHGIWATPALGDLDLDGRLDIIVLGLDGRLYAWHDDGTELRDGDSNPSTQGVLWVNPSAAIWSRGAPAVANILTDDATPEIVFGTENAHIYMLRADGSVAPGWPRVTGGTVSAAPSLGDIDHDGKLEVAAPCQDDNLYVLRADGSDLPGWPRALQNNWPGTLLPAVALHDFTGDGKLELVAASTGDVASGSLYIFDSQGNVLPGWPVSVHTSSEASPILGDLDGDSVPEIVYGGESGILYGFRSDGTVFPGFPIKVGAEVRATPLLTDANGDGRTDLVFSGWDQQIYIWSFKGLFVRRNVPWGAFKGNTLRNGVYAYRDPTDVDLAPGAPPARTALYSNVPNPFNPTTRIPFDIGTGTPRRARLRIFDVRGRLVRTLLDRDLVPGRYSELWDGRHDDGRSAASGVYFYRLETSDTASSRKMILVR